MKKIIYVSLLVGAAILQGCNSSTNHSSDTLSTFLAVHSEYCDAEFPHHSDLSKDLSKNTAYKALADFDGIYEKTVSNVSYAVSPEEDGCTTDLKLKTKGQNQLHFTFEQLNTELISKGYALKGDSAEREELGLDSVALKVVEQKYISPNNATTTLLFPLEREDQYYMTFFADKYEVQDASLKQEDNLSMFEI